LCVLESPEAAAARRERSAAAPVAIADADAFDKHARAIAAVSQAVEAAAELLRYGREGPGLTYAFDSDPISQLLDAAKLAMETSGETEAEGLAPVYAAIVEYLEGWSG
jgi:hypothetical protein